MVKYILLYNGPATAVETMSEEDRSKVMEVWKVWMENVGGALVDVGAPMINGKAIVDDGSGGAASELSGYSIIQAESMDEALKLVENHPFLRESFGKYKVEVFELAPVPMDM